MSKNFKFKLVKIILFLSTCTFFLSKHANAEPLRGNFANGQQYRGGYAVSDVTNSDGMKAHLVTLKLQLDNIEVAPYTYIADDFPNIKASSLGLLLISVKSGGMEGSVTFNYVAPYKNSLTSIGIVQMTLHLGKIESISVQRNKNMTTGIINRWVVDATQLDQSALENHPNIYEHAGLLLLGTGNFASAISNAKLDLSINSKDISDEPVLQKALKETISGRDVPSTGDFDLEKDRTLCSAGEDVYFSCQLDDVHKIVSVCAAKNISPDVGYVQYRYGTSSKLDFKYPANLAPPRNIMSIIDVSRTAQGPGIHLKFKNDDFTYVVSNALIPGEVYVAKNNKIIFDRVCKGTGYMPFATKARSGLPWGTLEKIDALDNH